MTTTTQPIQVDIAQAARTLESMLTVYDKRLQARDPNNHRLALYFKASASVFKGLPGEASVTEIRNRILRFYIVDSLPPAKNFIALLNEQTGPNHDVGRVYLPGYPKTRAARKKS